MYPPRIARKSRVDYNPYEGVTIDDSPLLVISRGRVVFGDDKFLGKPGRGQHLKRGTVAQQGGNPNRFFKLY